MNTRGRRKRIQWVIDNPIDAADKIAELEAKHTALVEGLRKLTRYRGVDGALVLYSADVAALLGDEK
jgi:hypothetical protein